MFHGAAFVAGGIQVQPRVQEEVAPTGSPAGSTCCRRGRGASEASGLRRTSHPGQHLQGTKAAGRPWWRHSAGTTCHRRPPCTRPHRRRSGRGWPVGGSAPRGCTARWRRPLQTGQGRPPPPPAGPVSPHGRPRGHQGVKGAQVRARRVTRQSGATEGGQDGGVSTGSKQDVYHLGRSCHVQRGDCSSTWNRSDTPASKRAWHAAAAKAPSVRGSVVQRRDFEHVVHVGRVRACGHQGRNGGVRGGRRSQSAELGAVAGPSNPSLHAFSTRAQ